MIGVPERIGHYRLESPIGVGGMGWVYAARDVRDGKRVAVTLMHEHLAMDDDFRKRFMREAKIASTLQSDNTVRVLDYGNASGRLFIAMEYVEGQSLGERLKSKGKLTGKEAVHIAVGIAAALEEAERNHVVHKDIRPENVLISDSGTVKVADFGISGSTEPGKGRTRSGALFGVVTYMAPEMFVNKPDHRSDVYAFGITLHEMLTGSPPFQGSLGEIVKHHQDTPVPEAPLSGIAPGLTAVILRCLQRAWH